MHTFAKRALPVLTDQWKIGLALNSLRHSWLMHVLTGLLIIHATPVVVQAAGKEPPAKSSRWISFVLSGTITNEKDEPLIGASITDQQTHKGGNTDANGKFLIEVESETDSLLISYVGYKNKTILAGHVRTITIKMEPDFEGLKLNEVQVVGYGTQKKTTMVGSVSTVKVGEIQKFSTPSLTNAIGGKLAGVITRQTSGEPGYDAAKIFIRGQVSQSGSNKPLIIVDGAERELQDYWTTMNIQDIESFSVLKDASATAVYGNRGANGVVLITTKHGSAKKPTVTLRTEWAQLTPIRNPEYIDGYEYVFIRV